MNNRNYIGIFDSGVGGLSVWQEINKQLPYESILYLADQAHVPYGSRSLVEIRNFAEEITRFLLKRSAKVIVIASNTISAAALYYLRNRFPDVPIVGMEPAIKPAIKQTQAGVVGVIATPATFKGEPFTNLVERYASNVRVLTQACPGLVEAVESNAVDSAPTKTLLQKYLTPLTQAGVDQLVLGCTHYPFLRPTIEQLVDKSVTIIDPAPAVARQTAKVLTERKLKTPSFAGQKQNHGYKFYTTGNVNIFTAIINRLLPLIEKKSMGLQTAMWQDGHLQD